MTRIPALGVKQFLQKDIFLIKFPEVFGVANTSYTLKWAFLPGTFFIIVALVTIFLHKMSKTEVKDAWLDSLKQISGAAIAIIFGLALVQIMRYSGSNDVNDNSIKSMIKNVECECFIQEYFDLTVFVGYFNRKNCDLLHYLVLKFMF